MWRLGRPPPGHRRRSADYKGPATPNLALLHCRRNNIGHWEAIPAPSAVASSPPRAGCQKELAVSTIELDWYLVHTRPRQEEVACEHLERQGYGVYLPRLQLPRRRRGRWHDVVEPLFPRYLFAGMQPGEQSLHPIRSTRGVSALVRGGDAYAPVLPTLLKELRAREDAAGLHQLRPDGLKQGDSVQIVAGPFAGLDAVFHSRQGPDRVRVLLTLIGTSAPTTLPAGLVIPAKRGVPAKRDHDAAA